MNMLLRTGLPLLLLAMATACRPEPPSTDDPPKPQAATQADASHTQMRDAIQAPLEKARGVQDTLQQAADAQRAAIDAQENAAPADIRQDRAEMLPAAD